ncbi:hypothetical protein XELAEV_18035009mg [Xenopus laevis]|uniref:Uncharacterized protein n=1 Tax=Xenopus laevis TaxID=8355 RepID=A0A974CEW9_XENLA|nr:hypothetical protein XELAEV_18035009mg [Xenopus laevis]
MLVMSGSSWLSYHQGTSCYSGTMSTLQTPGIAFISTCQAGTPCLLFLRRCRSIYFVKKGNRNCALH